MKLCTEMFLNTHTLCLLCQSLNKLLDFRILRAVAKYTASILAFSIYQDISGDMEFGGYSESETMSLMLVGGIILFSVIAIIAYIYTRGGPLFYLIAAVAIIIEFYMAYRISHEGEQQAKKPARKARK